MNEHDQLDYVCYMEPVPGKLIKTHHGRPRSKDMEPNESPSPFLNGHVRHPILFLYPQCQNLESEMLK